MALADPCDVSSEGALPEIENFLDLNGRLEADLFALVVSEVTVRHMGGWAVLDCAICVADRRY